jgi:hypothetical protein
MFTFTRLLTLATLAIAAQAAPSSTMDCDNPTVVSTETFANGVVRTTTTCAKTTVAARDLADVTDVCGEICKYFSKSHFDQISLKYTVGNNICSNAAGGLPPITDDCQQIKDAITIFQGNQGWALRLPLDDVSSRFVKTAPEFTVLPLHRETLSFNTCSFFFENDSPVVPYSYCWQDLVSLFLIMTKSCIADGCYL